MYVKISLKISAKGYKQLLIVVQLGFALFNPGHCKVQFFFQINIQQPSLNVYAKSLLFFKRGNSRGQFSAKFTQPDIKIKKS